jgi:hypothetical protein
VENILENLRGRKQAKKRRELHHDNIKNDVICTEIKVARSVMMELRVA